MIAIIVLAIFLVPLASMFAIAGTCVWYPQLLALQLMGGFVLAYYLWNTNKFISLFIAYLAISYIFVTEASTRQMLCLFTGYSAIAICLLASKLKSTKAVYISISVMAIFSFGYSMLQVLGHDPVFVQIGDGREDIVSVMGSHNQLGAYADATAFYAPFLIPVSLVQIYLAKCNSALLGLVAGGAIYTYFRYGFKILCIGLIAVLLLAIPWSMHCGKSKEELMERINLWKLTATQAWTGITVQETSEDETHSIFKTRKLIANPWFGFGLGKFFEYSPLSQFVGHVFDKRFYQQAGHTTIPTGSVGCPHYYEHAHNDFLEAFYEFGRIGILLIILCIISVVLLFIHSPKTIGVIITFASLVSQSVASLSIYIFHAPLSLFMFCLTLGLFYAEVDYAKQSTIKPIA